ncbi:MAG: tetratricopeptide repeat protein [Pyrinomonadaceae bacterium]
MERQGRFDDALSEIGDLWRDKTGTPDTEGLKPHLAAELILRCASLFGFLGHNKQIPNSQEKSRNLLTHTRNLFIELYDVEKIAECENHLALSYWRTGEINEAEIWLGESLSHNLPISSDARIYANIVESLIYQFTGKFDEIIENHTQQVDSVFRYGDNFLKGSFCTNTAVAFEKTGNTVKALEYLQKAHHFHLQSGHQIYLGTIQNNISQIYKIEKQFAKAHSYIDSAVEIFTKIKDRTREGFSLDTKAQIYYSEGKFKEALQVSEEALEILKAGENAGYLIESFETKIKVLISMDEISAATFSLIEAVQIAKTQISEKEAEKLVSMYEICLREHLGVSKSVSSESQIKTGNNVQHPNLLSGNIELVLPSPLSKFKNIQGIWITNTHLEKIGLGKNSLAVVVPSDEIEGGDLIAVEELENGNVSCGFYDNEFGIVCLEGIESEPLLFDAEKVKIIGKIVGVGNERTADGKLIVQPVLL